jgi:hypothetical protein
MTKRRVKMERTAQQQLNSDVCDGVLKNNERIHVLLRDGKFIPDYNASEGVHEVLGLLKKNDALVSQLDRGDGHVTLAPQWK